MHTVELLELAVATAEKMGCRVRQEWLGGSGGGACEVAGQKCVFLDLALNPIERLDQLLQALRDDPAVFVADIPDALRQALGIRKAA